MAGLEGHRSYAAFGLAWRSCVALPFRSGGGGQPDVVIRFGEVPSSLPPAVGHAPWQAAPGAFLLRFEGVAHFYVRNGREILIAADGGDERAISACLIGPVLAALLQQREVATLHGGAVEVRGGDGAAVFLGATASGKSSLLAALVDRGYALLADDLTGAVLTEGQPVILPAFPALRLWADALDLLGWRARPVVRVRDQLDKYEVRVQRFRTTPTRLCACYVLGDSRSENVSVAAVPSAEAFHWANRHSYRSSFLRGTKPGAGRFFTLSCIAKQVPTFRVKRALHPFRVDPLADAVERHLETLSMQDQCPTQADAHPCPSFG